jgi:glycosyltransferase involved in cell wall biosynthesis/SAM-dependent methyltransferase
VAGFPWTFDQRERYAVLGEFLKVFHPGGGTRVLDVGGLSSDHGGTSFWLPVRAVHQGESVVLDLPGADLPGYVRGDGTSLPFEDGSFDAAASLDVLEHVPADRRARFLAELVRVSRGSVFLCAPPRSRETEASDDLLFDQVRRLYRTDHVQLREHRLHGLPDPDEVDRSLAAAVPVGGGFTYGSLLTWLPYQTLRNAFLGGRDAASIHEGLDRWMSYLGAGRETDLPPARHFWIRSLSLSAAEFEARLAELRDRLGRRPAAPPSFAEMVRLHQAIVDRQTRTAVGGVVVSFDPPGDRLAGALDTLLTQDVDFDITVAVWDLAGREEVAGFLRKSYPAVEYFSPPPARRTVLAALGELTAELSAGRVLLMSEDIRLGPGTIRALTAKADRLGRPSAWTPLVLDEAGRRQFESGRREGEVPVPDKSRPGGGERFDEESAWIRSECLFFDRKALWDLREGERSLDRGSLFFWESIPGGAPALTAGDTAVHRLPPPAGPARRPPLKIVHAMHQYHPARGGAEWLMKNVSERLAARGHDVRVVATTARSTEDYFLPHRGKDLLAPGREDIGGVSVRRVPFTRRGAAVLNFGRAVATRIPLGPAGSRLRMMSWGPRSVEYARALEEAADADVIAAAPLPTANAWYAWKAARRLGKPFVLIPCFHIEDRYSFHNPLHYRMMRDAAAVIALSEAEKDFLCREGRLDPDKVHVNGAGMDLEVDESSVDIRARHGIRERRIVLFLGQHGLHKGILDLLGAMHHVWKEHPDTALVIAGSPTAHTAEIERKIAALPAGERERVRLVKGVPEAEKRSYYRAADVFVSVSPFESFGIVYLEAWREELPVVGCRRGAAAALIEEMRDGLLVHDGNLIELAGAVVELLGDEEARRAMGEAGRRKVAERFCWDRIIERWEGVYHDARGRRR